ncbi:MAG: hypothetical protein ABID45_03290 [Patescibacteria group bacterium]
MAEENQYQNLLSEIIAKQAVILGPEIAVLKARSVEGIEVDDQGKVLSVNGDPKEVLQKLVDAYVSLSGQIVKSAMLPLFSKYPDIAKVN